MAALLGAPSAGNFRRRSQLPDGINVGAFNVGQEVWDPALALPLCHTADLGKGFSGVACGEPSAGDARSRNLCAPLHTNHRSNNSVLSARGESQRNEDSISE